MLEFGLQPSADVLITLRTTQIRTDDNIEYIVPNGHFLDSIGTNCTRDTRKIQIHIAVAATYETSPQLVIAALRDAGEHPATMPDQPCDVLVTEFGERMVYYRQQPWNALCLAAARRAPPSPC